MGFQHNTKVDEGKFRTENLNLLRIEVTNLDDIDGKEEEIPRLNQIESFNLDFKGASQKRFELGIRLSDVLLENL